MCLACAIVRVVWNTWLASCGMLWRHVLETLDSVWNTLHYPESTVHKRKRLDTNEHWVVWAHRPIMTRCSVQDTAFGAHGRGREMDGRGTSALAFLRKHSERVSSKRSPLLAKLRQPL